MARERYDVRDKVVFITGAARGIGAEAARRMAARGAGVAGGLEPEVLEQVATRSASAPRFEADVTDWSALEAAWRDGRALRRDRRRDRERRHRPTAPSLRSIRRRRAHDRGEPARRLAHGPRHPSARDQRQGYILPIASLRPRCTDRCSGTTPRRRPPSRRSPNSLRAEIRHTGTRVGVAYFSFIDTDMVRDGLDSPPRNVLARCDPGPVLQDRAALGAGEAIERGSSAAPTRSTRPDGCCRSRGCAA